MSRRKCVWGVVLAALVGLMLPGLAEAKRFKRYPDDKKAQPAAEPTPRASQGDEGATTGGGYVAEEPPGLLGHAMHGTGGLTVEYIYTGEFFNNARGGLSTNDATKYLGLFDLAITADLNAMGYRPGGTVFVLAEDSHGRGITDDYVGDYQAVSNLDGGKRFSQVSEFWWQRDVVEGLISIRLGKQDANAEFGVVDVAGDFVNSSFGMQPSIPMPAWPDQAMGVLTFFQITDWLNFNVGVFDGAADGRTWGFSGTGEVFTVGEFKAVWSLLDGRLPGDCHVGMWYHNGNPEDPGDPGTTFEGNHGFHTGLEQMVWKESPSADDDQGLAGFVQYAWAPEERNEVPNYIGGGMVYKGLIPCRDDDVTGVGLAHVIFSNRMAPQDDETAIEVFHKIPMSSYFVIQPDIQYIVSPSGQERDALVAGVRFEIVL